MIETIGRFSISDTSSDNDNTLQHDQILEMFSNFQNTIQALINENIHLKKENKRLRNRLRTNVNHLVSSDWNLRTT